MFFISRPEGLPYTALHRVWKTRCVEKITLILGEAMGTVVAPTPQSGQPLPGMVPYPAFLVASLQRTQNMSCIVQDVLWGREHHNACQVLFRVNPSKYKQTTTPPTSARCVSKSTHRSRKHAWCAPFSGPHVVQMEIVGHKGPPENNDQIRGNAGEEVRFYPLKLEGTVSTKTSTRRHGLLTRLLPYCCRNEPQAWHKTSTLQPKRQQTPPPLKSVSLTRPNHRKSP